jgi:hypothetical protein
MVLHLLQLHRQPHQLLLRQLLPLLLLHLRQQHLRLHQLLLVGPEQLLLCPHLARV